ncbi:MAG: hypothetical protein ABIR78_09975 [Ferruginibacter sp.]
MKKIISLLLTCFVTGSFVHAQANLHNTGILFVNNSIDTLYINGDLTNTSTAALSNNGKVYVKQNLVNDQASMSAGTGTLYLNGTAAQTVSGTQVFKTYDLFTNNAAGILLNNNLSVAGTHTFSSGMINTSATPNYMIYEAGSSYTGSADNRHVIGWVKKRGATDFIFPVGNNLYQRTIALINLTASGEFNVKYNRGLTPNYTSRFDPLVIVDSSEYWTINKIIGAAAMVAMNWDNSKVPFPNIQMSSTRVANYDGSVFWRNIGGTGSGSALTTGNVTSNSVSVFNNNFTFGSVSYVLPLNIISFTALRMTGYTRLNWTIGNEMNVDRYELQRSDDGTNFYTIAVRSAYNRNGTELYSYDDSRILPGTVFYRLKINKTGNQVTYSYLLVVRENNSNKNFYVITNPVSSSIEIYADAAVKGVYNYTIANTDGQVMQSGILEIKFAGVQSIKLNPVFVPGAYILNVKNETNKLQKTIIKK